MKLPFVLYGLCCGPGGVCALVTARLVGDVGRHLRAPFPASPPRRPRRGGHQRSDSDRPSRHAFARALPRACSLRPADGPAPTRGAASGESLCALLAGLRCIAFVRRGLQPWTGSEQANAAGRAAARSSPSILFRRVERGANRLARRSPRPRCSDVGLRGVPRRTSAPRARCPVLLALCLAGIASALRRSAWFLPCSPGSSIPRRADIGPRLQRVRTAADDARRVRGSAATRARPRWTLM